MKQVILFGLCLLSTLTSLAQNQLQHPDQFLGYTVGQRFTPQHRVLAYAEYVARQHPGRVKLLPYGTTFEGRQLMAVVVASEKNLARLDEIRTSHLRRIGLGTANSTTPATTQEPQPPIAWLSYNVHGNEAISSEAFMLVLHDLLNASNPVSQKILSNTVVILDPCLNPDGHDRYVNWYNQVSGSTPDPTPFAREHSEPWPSGRYTHYLFDPNRDWAWQTQEITQQRMALYQQWMPHLHGDFHEMGPESPYYFAPSAKPYHEDITPWQRNFQQIIGQYNSRYFDKNGWLYFTRENFDLFYPSYGDTWPTYNGAIGMTFEQGGGGRAGLAYRKNDGDTLTLRERIDHHYTASFATLESIADRPDEVVKNFTGFFEKSINNPIGDFKSYVIKTANDQGRIKALRKLLDNNLIRYGLAGKAQKLTGFNYQTQKNEAVSIENNDLVISAYQPKSTLLKILFEPRSTLEDSVTYDITAWSIPYAYGLKAYGLKEKLTPTTYSAPTGNSTASAQASGTSAKPYAYLVRWQSAEDVQFLAGLLKNKVRVRVAERSFKQDNQTFDAGTLIITRAGNERLGDRLHQVVQQQADQYGIRLLTATTGFVAEGADFGSGSVFSLKNPHVAVLTGDVTTATSMGEVWHYFDQELRYPLTLIDGNALANASLSGIDVLILPQGYGYGRIMTDRTLSKLKEWVQAGGKLIVMERATQFFVDKPDWGLKKKDEKADGKKEKTEKKPELDETLRQYGEREREAVSEETPGSVYRVDLDRSHPLAYGYTNGYFSLVQNVYDYDFLRDGWNVGYLKKDNYVAGFVGKNAKSKLNNTLLHGVQDLGRGSVVYIMDDPLFRGFWYNGKLLFGNAVFMVGN